jgi:small subunit ribosomal protein S21
VIGGKTLAVVINIIGGAGRGSAENALRELKKKMQRELIYRCMKNQRYYEPPSVKKVRKGQEAARRRMKFSRRRHND